MAADRKPNLLAVLPFAANTGKAWDRLERLLGSVADRLAVRGIRTFVAYPRIEGPTTNLQDSQAEPVELDARLNSLASAWKTIRFLRKSNVGAMFLIDLGFFNPYFPLVRAAGIRSILTHSISSGVRTRATGLKRIAKWMAGRTPLSASRVLAVSDFVAERTLEVGLLPQSRILRLWNGVEVPTLDPEAGSRTRALFGIDPARPVVGCICRAAPEKGVDHLFRAFDGISRSWPENKEKPVLVYVGDGPMLAELEELKASFPGGSQIIMTGYIANAISDLEGADVFVAPSSWEDAFPYAVLEPMARGRPVVATRVGGIPEQIEDGVSGLLVPQGDIEAMSDAIRRVLMEPELARALGEQARRRVADLFSLEDQIDRLEDILLRSLM